MLPVGGTVLVLLYAGPGGRVTQALSWRPLVGIGLISYSAYLWHVPVLVLAELAMDTPPGPAMRIGLVGLILGLSLASWAMVEQPFRRRPVPLLPRRGQVFAASGAALGGMLAVGLAGMAWDGGLSAYSGVIRPVIPKVSGHPFRFYPAIDSGASGHPVM